MYSITDNSRKIIFKQVHILSETIRSFGNDRGESMKKSCNNCELAMPDEKGRLVCAGRTETYGQQIPIKTVDINECWELRFLDYLHLCEVYEKEAEKQGIKEIGTKQKFAIDKINAKFDLNLQNTLMNGYV